MDISKLRRNPVAIRNNLDVLKNGSVITKKGCRIQIPARFTEKSLATIGSETYTVGYFAMLDNAGNYAVSLTCASIRIDPSQFLKTQIAEHEYIEFVFEPGSVVFSSISVIREDTLPYLLYEEFIAKGRIPWYLNYLDLMRIYDNAEKYAGVRLGASHSVLEMIAASISRDPTNLVRYYRQSISNLNEVTTNPPTILPFRNVEYGATNTTARLKGQHFNDGLTAALVNPSERNEDIEDLLRA